VSFWRHPAEKWRSGPRIAHQFHRSACHRTAAGCIIESSPGTTARTLKPT